MFLIIFPLYQHTETFLAAEIAQNLLQSLYGLGIIVEGKYLRWSIVPTICHPSALRLFVAGGYNGGQIKRA
jgi:hypothetical protein